MPTLVGNLLINVPSSKGKHTHIHHAWSNNAHVGMRIRDMCFEISFLNKLGCVEDSRYQITGQCFNDMLSILNSFQSKGLHMMQQKVTTVNHQEQLTTSVKIVYH